MPTNLDQERRPLVADDQRQFTILGQSFTVRKRVRPEVLGMLEHLGSALTVDQNISEIDEIVRQVLIPEDRAKWDLMRASDDDDSILELSDMQSVVNWAMERLTDRPLEQSTSSPVSSAPIVPPLQVVSSLPEASPSTG